MFLGQEKLILTQDPKICAQYQTHKTNLFANKTKITTINWGIKASFWNFSEQDRFFFSVDKTLIQIFKLQANQAFLYTESGEKYNFANSINV